MTTFEVMLAEAVDDYERAVADGRHEDAEAAAKRAAEIERLEELRQPNQAE